MTRKMKDSGVSYLGDVTEDWKCVDFRRCVTLKQGLQIAQSDRFYEDGCNRYLYITIKYINSLDKAEKEYIENPDKGVMCAEKDILFVRTGSTGLTVTGIKGVFHNNFFKIIYDEECLSKNYLLYYLSQNNIQEHFKLLAGTTTISDLNHGDFLDTKIILPPIDIQRKIEVYLDNKCTKIDQTIEKEKRVIEKLKEYKQSVITESVTKGLNSDVKMKDSGVEWIGEIPKEWKIIKVKHMFNLKGRIGWQGLTSSEYKEQGPYLITGTDFKYGKIEWKTCVHITEERYEEAKQIQIENGDLLITKDGTVGKVAIVSALDGKASLNSGVLLIRPIKEDGYITKFMYYVLLSRVFWMWFESTKTGNSTIIHLYQEKFKEFSFTLPQVVEQQQIVDYLDNKCKSIDKLILDKEKLIEKLTEYKKSLIYECVTGKREV